MRRSDASFPSASAATQRPPQQQRRGRTRLLLVVVFIAAVVTLAFALDVFGGILGNGRSSEGGAKSSLHFNRRDRDAEEDRNSDADSQLQASGKSALIKEAEEKDRHGDTAEAAYTEVANEGAEATIADSGDAVAVRSGGGDGYTAESANAVLVGSGQYHNPFPPLNRSARPCSGLLYTQGRWVRRPQMQPRYPAYGDILGCCQRGYEEEHGKGAQRPETQYVWESDGCDLHEWDEELFCKALRGRNMMIAGDSLNDHWHASLYYLLGGRKDIYRREGTVRGKRACGTHDICHKYYPKPLKIYFLTNQLLEEERRLFRNYKWWKHIHNYPILILNSGSWMRDPADERREVSDDEYYGHMEKALRIVKRQNFSGTLIWRTTYQGHPNCWEHTAPLEREIAGDEFPRVPPYLRYRWWAIPQRNNYTVAMWRAAGAHILDVRRITNLMPLGHLGRYHPKFKERNTTDCLHYCSPGPVYDTWSQLLMNLLAGNIDGV